MKTKIILLALIAGTFIVLFATGGLRLQYGSSEHTATQQQIFSGYLMNVTGEVLMTPDGDTLDRWQEVVEQSRKLDFWLYSFSYQPLLDSFQRLARSGVRIRGIVENKQFGNDTKAFTKLLKIFTGRTFADIQSDEKLNDNFMHAKTFLTDDAFIIQTANLTYSSFFSNREFFFISYDPIIHSNLQALFVKDRSGEKLNPSDIHPNLLVCPIDCRHKIEILIS